MRVLLGLFLTEKHKTYKLLFAFKVFIENKKAFQMEGFKRKLITHLKDFAQILQLRFQLNLLVDSYYLIQQLAKINHDDQIQN